MKKESKLYSIFRNKCPRCHEGDVWPSKNPYRNIFKYKVKMYHHCSECGFRYEIETGFWWGAMYVSYGIGVALFVAGFILTEWFLPDDVSLLNQILIVMVFILVLAPVNFYYSRLVWANFFTGYQGKPHPKKEVKKPELV